MNARTNKGKQKKASPRDRKKLDVGELKLSVEEDFAKVNHDLGNEFYRKGEYEAAVFYYTKTIELNPNYVGSYFNRALAYARLEKYDKALIDLEKLVSLLEEMKTSRRFRQMLPEAYYTRGLVLEYLKRPTEAVESYTIALACNPSYIKALSERGICYARQGNYSNAMRDLTKALGDEKDPLTLKYLGDAYEKIGKFDDALVSYEKSFKLKPDDRVKKKIKRIKRRMKTS